MKQINDVDTKEGIANEIKTLVEKLNTQIELANKIFLRVHIRQGDSWNGRENCSVTCYMSETVSY